MATGTPYKQNDQVGSWKLERPLGQGGQGQVWKVRHTRERHSPPAALKVCTSIDEKSKARFAREVAIMRGQQHPGLVSIRDAGEHDGIPFFVLELANATMDRLKTAESAGLRILRESPSLLLTFFRQACAGVAHLHEKGIIHRDIKPSNVLLVLDPPEPMRAVVADLGTAAVESTQGVLTGTQEVVGSPVYRAPESLLPGPQTPASDVYALGKTLEFLFTGAVPAQLGPGRCLRSPGLSDDLWDELDEVLGRACAYEPKRRFKDANSLLCAIPEVVLVKASPRPPASAAAGEVSLGRTEMRVLAVLIAECPTDEQMAVAGWIASKAGLNNYQFSMGLRELRRLGFVESRADEDPNSNPITLFRPSEKGFDWARTHPEEMGSQVEARAGDDDIPF